MRNITASVLAAAALAGGALTGAALATPTHPATGRAASVDRAASMDHGRSADRRAHESIGRDHRSPRHERSDLRDR